MKPTTPLLTPNKGPLKPASPLHPKNAPKRPFRTRKGDGGFRQGSAGARKGDGSFDPIQMPASKGDTGFRRADRLVYRTQM